MTIMIQGCWNDYVTMLSYLRIPGNVRLEQLDSALFRREQFAAAAAAVLVQARPVNPRATADRPMCTQCMVVMPLAAEAASARGPHDEHSGLLQQLHDDGDGERASFFSVGKLAMRIVGTGTRSDELASDIADVMAEDARTDAEEIGFEAAAAIQARVEIERLGMMQGMGETPDTPRSAAQGQPFFVRQVCDPVRETLVQPPARLSPAHLLHPGYDNWG
jgi:hypothetical protein